MTPDSFTVRVFSSIEEEVFEYQLAAAALKSFVEQLNSDHTFVTFTTLDNAFIGIPTDSVEYFEAVPRGSGNVAHFNAFHRKDEDDAPISEG